MLFGIFFVGAFAALGVGDRDDVGGCGGDDYVTSLVVQVDASVVGRGEIIGVGLLGRGVEH